MTWRRILPYLLIIFGFVLQVHNAILFNPAFGLDSKGHQDYLQFLLQNHKLPFPHEGWEFHQTPLYYLISLPAYTTGGLKAVQLQNVLYYFTYLIFAGLLISKLFPKEKDIRLIATLSLLALPVFNYLVPMVSNEFLNSTIIGLTLLLMMIDPYRLSVVLLLIVGFYTKYTVLTLGPAYLVALLIGRQRNWKKIFLYGVIFGLSILPVIYRNYTTYHRLLPLAYEFFPYQSIPSDRNLSFFTNLKWIPEMDLFHAHNYSFLGGTWNTFWHDGYQLTVPVTNFHKKAAVLWILGFPLTFLTIFGWVKIKQKNISIFLIGMTYFATALAAYISYNLRLPYESEVKAFFMSGLPIGYTLGIVGCYNYMPKLRKIIVILLIIQLILMISYFWILPWWHIAR